MISFRYICTVHNQIIHTVTVTNIKTFYNISFRTYSGYEPVSFISAFFIIKYQSESIRFWFCEFYALVHNISCRLSDINNTRKYPPSNDIMPVKSEKYLIRWVSHDQNNKDFFKSCTNKEIFSELQQRKNTNIKKHEENE